MKFIALMVLSALLILSGCASKSVTKQDRNEILIDDLYTINKSLHKRIDDLEAHVKLFRKSISGTNLKHSNVGKTSFQVKGKVHEINENIYYGNRNKIPADNKPNASSITSEKLKKKPRKKKYSELAKELDKQIATQNQTASNNKAQLNNDTQKKNLAKQINPNFKPIEKFSASAFRTTQEVQLVNGDNQPQIIWGAGTSFTAKESYGDYYKISGFFIDKQWTQAAGILLIPISQASKR